MRYEDAVIGRRVRITADDSWRKGQIGDVVDCANSYVVVSFADGCKLWWDARQVELIEKDNKPLPLPD
jgi:hypothetical protein